MKYILILIIFTFPSSLLAEDDLFNEADLFNDTAMIVDSQSMSQSFSSSSVDSNRISFSGAITSLAEISAKRDWFKNQEKKDLFPGASITGNGLLDIRFPFGFKAFANFEAQYESNMNSTNFALQELFIDANIKKKVYFRTGKQVLQWGRCFFWNPTDLVNVEKKKFIQDIGYLEGTYGIRAHVPFGTRVNLYGFVDMNHLSAIDSLAATAKVEVLLGNIEISTALWGKKNKDPVLGLDFSTSLLNINIAGELSLTSGYNYSVPDKDKIGTVLTVGSQGIPVLTGSIPMTTLGNHPVARACLSLSKSFDLLDVNDRVTVITEFYFNGAGFSGNLINQYKIGDLLQDMQSVPLNPETLVLLQNSMSGFLVPNNHSKWYGAFFINVNKFIISDLTLTFNGIANFNHRCGMISTGFQYTNLHRFTIGLLLNGVIGSKNTEYTINNDAATMRLTAGVSF